MKKKDWLLVANSSVARLYQFNTKHSLTELRLFDHPESRLHNLDLVSDKPGRDAESMGESRHALEVKTTPKQHEFILFAKHLADYLEEAFNKKEFDYLYIAASPNLLGLLRQALHPTIAKIIKGEVDKDITHVKTQEIPSYLPFLF